MIGLLYDITTHYVLSLVSVTDVFNADQSLHWLLAVFVQYISKLINNQDNQQKGFFFLFGLHFKSKLLEFVLLQIKQFMYFLCLVTHSGYCASST